MILTTETSLFVLNIEIIACYKTEYNTSMVLFHIVDIILEIWIKKKT